MTTKTDNLGRFFDQQPTDDDATFMRARGWREPLWPYVVFRAPKWETLDDKKQETTPVTKLLKTENVEIANGFAKYFECVSLNVGGCHKRKDRIDYYLEKGAKILAWGRFPKPESYEARVLSDGPGKPTPWQVLDAHLRVKIGQRVAVEGREQAFEAEIAAARARIAELEKQVVPSAKGQAK